ncbi:uncharacterized protein LOC106170189 [Lingula anatina]|uniref:Uncharacterized protein LOC106170189 n=1 Tax=Lingula anatina TaxID=7574 RepID=A0A1S3J6E5_LINAN|nr:uncharacterized protein LOC106170189 [Lingula anatina]XP_013405415.1 uncharacterized protein LOC106170189 [Lingula anatina]|eukprot:XP_013405414.1 uncharacterized protein LOC106170189 [Lingula anatina]
MEDKNHESGVPCEEVVKEVEQPKQDEDQNRAGAAAAASEDVESEFLSEPVPAVDQNGPCEHVCTLASSLSSSQRSSVLSQSSFTTDYEHNFYCLENEDFWTSMPGGSFERKKWGSFLKHLGEIFNEDTLATEERNNTTLKVLKRILQLEDSAEDSDEIKVEAFIRFVGWFGPMKAEDKKCIALREVNILHKGSTIGTEEGKRKSWFAGYLDRPKAEEYLINEKVGTYLVR